VAENKPIIAAS